MKGAGLMVSLLEECGARVLFGHPGGAVLPLYDALRDAPLRHILVRHEQNAAHMADGYARMLRRPGVCVATSGPGATNLVTGVATAFMDSSPVVAITGQVANSSLGSDAFQEIDAFGMFMPIVKHNWRVERAGELPAVVRKAFGLSMAGRPGPVHIDLPLDVQREEVRALEPSAAPTGASTAPPALDQGSLLEAVRLLEAAQSPVILVGGGARWNGAAAPIVELAETLQAPIVTTLMGKGTVPEDHPLVLGAAGMHGKMVATYCLQNGDTVVALGTRFSDRTVGTANPFGTSQRIVHVDIDASEFGKNVKGVVRVAGDLGPTVVALLAGLRGRIGRRETAWSARVRQLQHECACDFALEGDPILPQRVIFELNRALPQDAVLTTEVGRHQMWAEHFFIVGGRRRFFTSGGLGTMGFGFPAAIGAKVAAPDRFVLDLAGDGSFQMTMKELATARENDIPVAVLVMNDSALGMVLQWQRMLYDNRLCSVDLGRVPDFVKIAEAYGCHGVRVERASEISGALAEAQRADRPTVIDVPVDPRENVLPFLPPGKSSREVVLGPRCIWKGGEALARRGTPCS